MTGYDEAADWLQVNAPGWRLQRAQTSLAAGVTIGAPTVRTVTADLVEADALVKQQLGLGYVTLTGEGSTILEAVEAAVGGLRHTDTA